MPQHRASVAAAGLALSALPVDARGARTDLLARAAAAAAVLSPAHQFPTGVVLHRDRRAAAVAWAAASGGLVVEDDYDGELRYDRQPVGALQALAPDHVVYGGTASKTLAPGLRLGWLVVPPRLLEPIVSLRTAEDVHVPAPDQIALCELLRSGAYERHVRRMRARYRGRRDRLRRDARRARAGARAGRDLGRARGAASSCPTAARRSAELIEEAATPLDRAGPAGAALSLDGARAARRRRDRLRRAARARLRGRPRARSATCSGTCSRGDAHGQGAGALDRRGVLDRSSR